MSQPLYRIRGVRSESRGNAIGGHSPIHRLIPGSARDGAADEIEVAGNTVVRVELDNGFVLWSRVDNLTREYGTPPAARSVFRRKRGEADGGDDNGAWEFSRLTPQRASSGERGMAGLAIRVLDFFGVDVVQKSASALGIHFEEKLLGDHPPGFYRLDLAGAFRLHAVPDDAALAAGQGPLLVFLHGTASSTDGSFGKLWDPANAEGARLRQALAPTYGERVFALEHRTLSESPIANALALARRLPAGAEVHLVSHSRGGLVGEVLALSGSARLAEVLTAERLQTLFAADRTLAPQLGLSPLAEAEAKERDAAYAADRQRLGELVALLGEKKLRVTRFVRVACPARGTTLASGRLDRWLSVLDYLVTAATGNGLFADGLDFLLAVVKERTDPRTLPGLEAMMPGSALTRLLNGTPELVSNADLSVIAGDIEAGDGLWNTLKVLASDWFYRNEHDLVVDTGSMSGGLPRPANGARMRQDQGSKVNHFRYFTNEQSVRWLRAGLARNDGDSAGFLPIADAAPVGHRCQEAVARSRGGNKPRPIAVVLPGTMGSQLRVDDDTIWLDYWALLKGGLKRLAMGRDGIVPVGLVDQFYGPLVEFLARSHQVEIFPYDWRHSVRQAAARLAETLEPLVTQAERGGQPLRLVAHSMGGLVVRAMIADGGAGSALWQRITRLPGSRFLMLGTPNLGSYEAVRWLTGFNPTQTKLALLDITQSTDQIIGLVSPLPRPARTAALRPGRPRLRRCRPLAETAPGNRRPLANRRACLPAGSRGDLEAAQGGAGRPTPHGLRCRLPAGHRDRLPADARHRLVAARAQAPRFHRHRRGRRHGELAIRPPARRARLVRRRHRARHAVRPAQGLPRLSRPPGQRPDRPAAGDAASPHPGCRAGRALRVDADAGHRQHPGCGRHRQLRLFRQRPGALMKPSTRPAPTIEVAIRHGNLAYARHPVVVGHYQGDTVVSAEAVLDKQSGGALTRRLDLGIYPGALGSNTVFLNDSPSARPGGAIVVGLGQVGGLSPGLLEDSLRTALLDFALDVAHWPDKRFGDDGRPRSAAVTCLLIGTGAGGLPVGDALEAILRAAVAANRRLADQELDGRVLIDRLEFLELYEDVAILAADALTRVLQNETLAAAVRWPAAAVEAGQAGRWRVRFEQAPEWYQRLEIIEDAGRLRFVFTTDRARAEETLATGQLALVDSFVRIASRDTGQNSEVAKTLFEMLLPLRLRELSPQQGNLLVMVDRDSARYPWELLENRWATGERPPAVAAGFIRQFRTIDFRQRPVHGAGNTALVVGNPDLAGSPDFADLPGAREEAQARRRTACRCRLRRHRLHRPDGNADHGGDSQGQLAHPAPRRPRRT